MAAAKSILDIEVNSAQFEKFQALFQKHQAELAKLPSAWHDISSAAAGAATSAAKVGATGKNAADAWKQVDKHLQAADAALARIREGASGASNALGTTAHSASSLARSSRSASESFAKTTHAAKGFAAHIWSATRGMLKWGSITGAITGLAGAGGLFGLDRLAYSAAAQRKTAIGFGVTPQEQQAFKINYSRYFNTDSLLEKMSAAKVDPTRVGQLMALGIPYADIQSKDAAQLSLEAIQRAKAIIGNKVPSNAALIPGLGLFSTPDLRQIAAATPTQLAARQAHYAKDLGALTLPSGTRLAWQSLTTQMSRAGTEIENVFVKGLVSLEVPLHKLSGEIVTFIQSMANSGIVKTAVNDLGAGLMAVAKYLGSKQFQSDVQTVGTDMEYLAKSLVGTLRWWGFLPGGKNSHLHRPVPPHDKAPGVKHRPPWEYHAPGFYSKGPHFSPHTPNPNAPTHRPTPPHDMMPGVLPAPFSPWNSPWNMGGASSAVSYTGGAYYYPASYSTGQFGGLENQYGLPPGLLSSVQRTESGGNPYAVSPTGAEGAFQFEPGTARQYGLTNPFDPRASAIAAARMFRDLLAHYHGKVAEAVAAYNWGSGNVDKDLAAHGGNWRNFLPRETRNYLTSVLPGVGRQTHVYIHDNTGGNVVVTAAQLAV